MNQSVKNYIKKFLPAQVVRLLKYVINGIRNLPNSVKEHYLIKTQPRLHQKALKRVKEKFRKGEPLNVVFFALDSSIWKFDCLYKLLEEDNRFNPIILVCPIVNYGHEYMINKMDECYDYFQKKDYNMIKSYDSQENKYIDAKSLNPDIIFYTNPYKGLIDDRYYITNFREYLTGYVNYFFNSTKYSWSNSLLLHKLVWKYFLENEKLKNLALHHQGYNNPSILVTGYPIFDQITTGKEDCDLWKIKDPSVKRIIFSPHHTIEDDTDINQMVKFSNFFKYYDFIQKLAIKYKDKIQIVFKPHPLLKPKLYQHKDWGKKRTDEYYDFWVDNSNTNLCEGEYIDLFSSSDAIIHDCNSFTAEYLVTGKPALYLSDFNHESQLNDFGKEMLSVYYIGKNKEEIESFILDVINHIDPMESKRIKFVEENLILNKQETVAQRMLESVIKDLKS